MQMKGYCRFDVEYATSTVQGMERQVEALVKDAFKVAGEWIDGTTDPSNDMAVPDLTLNWTARRAS